jgi:hypothetical protein
MTLSEDEKDNIRETIEAQAELFTGFLSKLWLELGLEDQKIDMNNLVEREEDKNNPHKSAYPKYMGRGRYER